MAWSAPLDMNLQMTGLTESVISSDSIRSGDIQQSFQYFYSFFFLKCFGHSWDNLNSTNTQMLADTTCYSFNQLN